MLSIMLKRAIFLSECIKSVFNTLKIRFESELKKKKKLYQVMFYSAILHLKTKKEADKSYVFRQPDVHL